MIYCSFNHFSSIYQIMLFKSEKNKIPQIFLYESKLEYELFIDDDNFVVYKNNCLLFYKKISEEINLEDLSIFIQNYFGVNNIKVTYSKNINLTNNTNHKFIKPIKSNFFKYYLLFLIITSSLFFYFLLENKIKTSPKTVSIQNNINKFKKDREFYSLTKMILILYEKAKKFDVVIDSIVIKNSSCLLSIETKNKDVIYKYFESIPTVSINNIFFDKQLKRYKIDASFKLPRK